MLLWLKPSNATTPTFFIRYQADCLVFHRVLGKPSDPGSNYIPVSNTSFTVCVVAKVELQLKHFLPVQDIKKLAAEIQLHDSRQKLLFSL